VRAGAIWIKAGFPGRRRALSKGSEKSVVLDDLMLVSASSLVIKLNTAGYSTTLFLRVKNEVYQALTYVRNVNPIIVKIFQKNRIIRNI
jgi:hypothetical protein